MGKYKIEFTKQAAKEVAVLNIGARKRLKNKLKFYLDQPDPLRYAARLQNRKDGQYRWRIGYYRVVFDVKKSAIIILRVQHRKEVYR